MKYEEVLVKTADLLDRDVRFSVVDTACELARTVLHAEWPLSAEDAEKMTAQAADMAAILDVFVPYLGGWDRINSVKVKNAESFLKNLEKKRKHGKLAGEDSIEND